MTVMACLLIRPACAAAQPATGALPGGPWHFDESDRQADFGPAGEYGLMSADTFAVSLRLRTERRDFCTPLMAREGGDVSFSFVLGREPGRIAWELWSWANVSLRSQTDVADGKWHDVIGAYDAATGYACLLVDGRLEAVAEPGPGGPKRALLRLGNNIGCDQRFTGDLDAVTLTHHLPEAVAAALGRHGHWTLIGAAGIHAMQQAYLDRLATPRNPHAKAVAEWEARRKQIREQVLWSLGLSPLPERLPLKVHVSGQLDRDGYIVKRLYWQTWPHYYASGYLYLPKGLTGKVPAILNPHGHWENGCRNPVVQARLISLARKGYVCLTIDSVHAYDYYAGVTPLTLMTWNNIRGIDLLCSLPEVDPTRIGCTGCSGGGQQTLYLMAVEDRIAAAVPVCMVCEFRRIMGADFAHCPCNHVAGILAETDQTEMAACLAPKPSLYICVTQDWTKWFPQEGYPEIRSIFDLYGKTNPVQCFQHDWGHDYSLPMREQAYAWFNRWLKGIDDPAQAKEAPFQPESLETLASLDGPPPDAREPEAVFAERRAARARPEQRRRADPQAVREDFARVLREPETLSDPAPEVLDHEVIDGLHVTRLLIRTEPDIKVPVVLLLPEHRSGRLPALVVVSDRGKAALLDGEWPALAALVNAGFCVALPDVRCFGEWSLRADVQRLNGILLGRPPAAVGTHDLLAVAAWLRTRPEVQPDSVGVIGTGDAGPLALMAAALDPAIRAVMATDIGRTYAEGRTDPTVCHLVTVGDLPEVAAACGPRAVWIGGVSDSAAWRLPVRAWAALNARERLRVEKGSHGLADAGLARWLAEALDEQR